MEQSEIENLIVNKLSEINNSKNVLNSIYYDDESQLEEYIENMTSSQALLNLINSSKMAFNKGCFNLIESEIISKSIRILSK